MKIKAVSCILAFSILSSYTAFADADITVQLDGSLIEFDQTPIILDGRTMVPIRAIFEAIGYDVDWDQNTQTASAVNEENYIIVTENSSEIKYKLNGIEDVYICDVPAQIVSERMLVPVRAISESAGLTVGWNGETMTVNITSPVPFSYEGSFGERSYQMNYTDDFFNEPVSVYNPKLSVSALQFALAGFTSNESDTDRDKNIKELYSSLGFTGVETYGYDIPLSDSSDKAAYSLAYKDCDDKTIVAIVVRGGGYGAEWSSNFNVGKDAYHTGFYTAAKEITNSAQNYLSGLSAGGHKNIKVLVTGYSRGAAIAGITAANLITEDAYDIYGYTFAAPQWIDISRNIEYTGDFSHIFNIVSCGDIVPQIPLSIWGYERLGTDVYLDELISTADTEKIEAYFTAITGTDNASLYISTITDTSANDTIIDLFSLSAPTLEEYNTQLEENLRQACASEDADISNMGTVMLNHIGSKLGELYASGELQNFLSRHNISNAQVTAALLSAVFYQTINLDMLGISFDNVSPAHAPELYLSALIHALKTTEQ
ncbi:MAG: hypothetical protein J1G06_00025 [Oscillospiraceae bacterium]|nr:hypothetical protein [Oscillospiraceae bacterium]